MQPFNVLPDPETGGLLTVATEPLLARAAAEGVPTVAAWGFPALLPLADAARLTAAIERGDELNGRANAARDSYRELAGVKRALVTIAQQRAAKAEEAAARAAHAATIPARRAADAEEAARRGDPRSKNPDEGLPPFVAFERHAEKAAV